MKIAFIVLLSVIFMILLIFILLFVTGKLGSVIKSAVSIITGSLKMYVGG